MFSLFFLLFFLLFRIRHFSILQQKSNSCHGNQTAPIRRGAIETLCSSVTFAAADVRKIYFGLRTKSFLAPLFMADCVHKLTFKCNIFLETLFPICVLDKFLSYPLNAHIFRDISVLLKRYIFSKLLASPTDWNFEVIATHRCWFLTLLPHE